MQRQTESLRKHRSTRREMRRRERIAVGGGNTMSDAEICSARSANDSAYYRDEITFGEVLNAWMAENAVSHKGSTKRKYEYLISRHIMPQLGEVSMCEINSALLNKYIAEKKDNGRLDGTGGLSSAYIRGIVAVVNSAVNYAIAGSLCPPFLLKTHKPPIHPRALSVFSKEESAALEHYLHQDMNATKLGVYLALSTGLRMGEICSLKWKDIDLDSKIIHVRSTVTRVNDGYGGGSSLVIDLPKTRASVRDIPISNKLFAVLLGMKDGACSEYIASVSSSFVSPRTFEYRYHKILDECGVRHLNFHAIRHTFATKCIEAGVDIKTVSELLGHSSAATTLNIYVHSSMEHKRQQIEKL